MRRLLCVCFLLSLFVTSCNRSENTAGETLRSGGRADTLSADKAILYVLPSPLQVSSILHLTGASFDESLIRETRFGKYPNATSTAKSLLLGANMIDFSYVIFSDEVYSHTVYFETISRLMEDLGMRPPDIPKEYYSIDSNKHNDSIAAFGKKLLKNIEEYFALSENKKIPMLIICGMYIEGLYLMTEIYNRQINDNFQSPLAESSFYNLLLQQQVFLDNLQELLAEYEDDSEVDKINSWLSMLELDFNNLKLSFVFDSLQQKITEVDMDKSFIPAISSRIRNIRTYIVNV